MCGIAGLIGASAQDRIGERLDAMAGEIVHRGPDDSGTLCWGSGGVLAPGASGGPVAVGLAFRRLSILDLTDHGHQPMSSPDGRHHLVFNGEIYNYLELRPELERAGWRFRSSGDTEVLLAALATWGSAAHERIDGMFGFAHLDAEAGTVTLVRDRLGIKPLFHAPFDGGLAFASETGALRALPGVGTRADAGAVYDFLRFGLTGHDQRTFFADIESVPPGHRLVVPVDRPGAARLERWWSAPPRRGEPDGPWTPARAADAAERVRAGFLAAIGTHLRSDVPVGAALSGGIDSSGIVGAIRAVQGDAVELHTFSYVTDEPDLDEQRFAVMVREAKGAIVHEVRIAPEELAGDVDDLIASQGEPFGGTSIYAQRRVFELAREAGITVMLDGQGADELFGGYRAHLAARIQSLLRQGRAKEGLALARAATALPGGESVARTLARIAWGALPSAVAGPARRRAERSGAAGAVDHRWFAGRGVVPTDPGRHSGKAVLAAELTDAVARTSLPALLRYEDRNSMRWSIESRVPYLDHRLVELASELPEPALVDDAARSKAVLRDALRGLVPEPVLDRKDKIGYGTPELRWLRALGPWFDDVVREAALPFIDQAVVAERWQRARAGGGSDPVLWRIANVARWSTLLDVEVA